MSGMDAAPVSGPGRMSRRTDLGPAGSGGQPVRVPTGGAYGDAKAAREQQSGAPMQSAPAGMTQGVFGPTARPGEPVTDGAPLGPGASPEPVLADDPDMLLRAMYRATGHPDLLRLLQRGKGV